MVPEPWGNCINIGSGFLNQKFFCHSFILLLSCARHHNDEKETSPHKPRHELRLPADELAPEVVERGGVFEDANNLGIDPELPVELAAHARYFNTSTITTASMKTRKSTERKRSDDL